MGGIQGPRGAGRARGCTDTVPVQQQENGFTLHGIKPDTEGVGQAKDYATRLQIRYTYSTNGLQIYGMDMQEGSEGDVSKYPSPDELWEMTFPKPVEDYKVEIVNWKEKLFSVPFEDRGGTWQPRYYQDNAIHVLSSLKMKKYKK